MARSKYITAFCLAAAVFASAVTATAVGLKTDNVLAAQTISAEAEPAEIVISDEYKNITVYEGDTITIKAQVSAGNHIFQWLKDGKTVAGQTSSTLTIENSALSDSGEYKLQVTTIIGTTASVTASEACVVNVVHVHKWNSEYTVDKAPSCTQGGSESLYCSTCGEISDTVELEPLGHDWSEWETVVMTDCEDDAKQRVCNTCGLTETQDLDVSAHEWEDNYTVDKQAGCITDGSSSVHCKICGISKESTTILPLGHDYTEEWTVDTEPTCTKEGSKSHHCARCGEKSDVTAVEKAPHEYVKETVDPTYWEEGYTKYTCSKCGDTYNGDITDILILDKVSSRKEYTNTSSAIRVNWYAVEGAAGYIVERSTDGKTWTRVARISGGSVTNHLDNSGLKDGAKYLYRIKAFVTKNSIAAYSEYSDTVTAWTKPANPNVKTDYTCTSTAIRINWNKVAGASGYKIFRYNEKTKAYELIGKVNNNTTFNYLDSKCSAGTTYKYQVQAFTNKGDNTYLYSGMSSTITAATKPAATKITKNTQAKTAVRLYWNKVNCTGYKIQQYKNGSWETIKKVAMNTTEYRVEGLKASTSYKFRIQPYYTVNGKVLYGAVSETYTAKTAN